MKPSLLKVERKLRGWSQAQLAEALGVSTRTVRRWELGLAVPQPYYIEQWCALFDKTPEELAALSELQDKDAAEASTQRALLTDPAIPATLESTGPLLGRQDILTLAKDCLCEGESLTLMALDGLPGIGTSSLAVALANDREVQASFQDGILWAGLGQEPNVTSHLARWAALLGSVPPDKPNSHSRVAWRTSLQAEIGQRRLLLVIDDACTIEDALAFQVGGPQCVYLLTTRLPQVASSFAQQRVMLVPHLQEEDGLAVLARLAPQPIEQDPTGALALVRAVEGLPLALSLMGHALACQAFPNVQAALEAFHHTQQRLASNLEHASGQGSASLAEVMPLSLETTLALCDQQLSSQAHAALCALAVFPSKPQSFSKEAALVVSQQPEETLERLLDLGLLENCGAERYSLHEAVTDYARVQSADLAIQEQAASSGLEDVQLHQRNSHPSIAHELAEGPFWELGTPRGLLSPLRLFRWFSSRLLLIVATILLMILIIITFFWVFPLYNSQFLP